MQTLYEKLKNLPPYKVRLAARHKQKRRPLTNEEIHQRCGLAEETVRRVSRLRSWNKVGVETLLRFCAGCGVEMLQQKRVLQFIRETDNFKNAAHLKYSGKHSHNRKFYEALMDGRKEWRNHGLQPTEPGISPR